jgi:hypothetical protein
MCPVHEYHYQRISWLSSIHKQLNHFHYFSIPLKSSEIFISISCLFFQSDLLPFQLPALTFVCISPPYSCYIFCKKFIHLRLLLSIKTHLSTVRLSPLTRRVHTGRRLPNKPPAAPHSHPTYIVSVLQNHSAAHPFPRILHIFLVRRHVKWL